MKILITGGSGDLGSLLIPLLSASHEVINLDLQAPKQKHGDFIQGSILDRELLTSVFQDIDVVIHIAAWHGIHEFRNEKSAFDFWDLNVTGTFNVFEHAARNTVKGVINISSTSIDEWPDLYGASKVLNEELARTYAARHQMRVVTLRPRAFIPYWNKSVYNNYVEWVKWFWGGAVHINDVVQSVEKSLSLLISGREFPENLVLNIDGAYDYPETILEKWDKNGAGSSFKEVYPAYVDLAFQYGLDTGIKPSVLDIEDTKKWIDYDPEYSLKNLLEELAKYGIGGPPVPFM